MKKKVFYFFLFATIFFVLSIWYIMADQPFGRVYIRPETYEYTQRVYLSNMLEKLLVVMAGTATVMIILLGSGWAKKK